MVRILHIMQSGIASKQARYLCRLVNDGLWHDVQHHVCLLGTAGSALNGDLLTQSDLFSVQFLGEFKELITHRAARRIVTQALQQNIRHLHLHGRQAFVLAAAIRKHAGDVPLRILASLDVEDLRVSSAVWPQWRMKHAGRAVDQVILNSRSGLQQCLAIMPDLAQRIRVIPKPLLHEADSHDRKWRPFPNHVLFAADFLKRGDARTVLQLAQHLQELSEAQFKIECRSNLSARTRHYFAAQAEKEGLPVTFSELDSEDNTLDALMKTDLAICPSTDPLQDAYISEAQSVGTPCIAFLKTAASESVLNGKTGYLVEQGDLHAMATILARLMRSVTSLENLGRTARGQTARLYGMDRHIEALQRVYLSDPSATTCLPRAEKKRH